MTSASESVPKALTTVFDEAEAAIKKYERLTLSLPVAAVNQLRYAAKHFARATKCECGSLEAEAHYAKARCHCERAKFDALDGIIYSSLDFIAAFQKMCRTRRGVEEIYPEIRSDYDAIAALQERIQLLPKVQDMSSGDMAEMEELAGKFLSFKRKILRLMPAVEARKRLVVDMSARNAAKQFLASFLVSVAGTFVGVLGTFCAIWMSPSYSLLWRIAVSAGMLVLFALATWRIYVFAVRKMLTPEQREALLGVDEFSFA